MRGHGAGRPVAGGLGIESSRRVPVEGSSMHPLLRDGDSLELDWQSFTVAAGDIILYRDGEETIVHRVVAIRAGDATVVTKGDNLPWCDPPVPPERILARVTAAHSPRGTLRLDTRLGRAGGWCAAWLSARQPAVWSLLRRAGTRLLRMAPWAAAPGRRLARVVALAPLRLFLGIYACACWR